MDPRFRREIKLKFLKGLTGLLVLFANLSFAPCAQAVSQPQSICFYYNEVDSVRELMNYERVVLDPAQVTSLQLKTLKDLGIRVYAYLSVGEMDDEVPEKLQDAVKTENEEWGSAVMDVSAKSWSDHLLTSARSLKKRGFDGLFLDTLDSFNVYADSDTDADYHLSQVKALRDLVTELHALMPRLILNRGFEILDALSFKPDAVAFESLFQGYSASDESYHEVSEDDRAWLLSRVNPIKEKGIEIIAVDYLPEDDLDARIVLSQKILDAGFTPYVADGMLYGFGVSTVYPVPKRVLGLYDGRYASQLISSIHTRITTPLEYQGYVVDTVDINHLNYRLIDKTRYRAVVAYFENPNSYYDNPEFEEWIRKHVGYLPMLFLASLPQDPATLDALGITIGSPMDPPYRVKRNEELSKGLLPPRFSSIDQQLAITIDKKANLEALTELEDKRGRRSALVIKAPWGGAAVYPYPVNSLNNNEDVWVVEPFKFLDTMLRLPKIPAADATTESGRRILTAHVDGDGFPSRSWFKGSPLVSEVLYDEIFTQYDLPQTVSVIEGEVGPDGLYPNDSPMLEDVARKIFALPNVEIASHTFSHPFNWNLEWLKSNLIYGEHLDIPGYKLDYDKEMSGTIDYINSRLAPEGKKVEVLLWSGDANPSEELVDKANKLGVLNLNGGNTTIRRGQESLTNVSPTIIWYRDGVQVYAPEMNENVYTHEWTEHFDGFARARETYELTGSPRRLKTISIYYHMYSGTYEASLNALKSLYDWALTQEVTPLYISDYARRARTLYETGLAKDLNGQWRVTSSGIGSIRVPKSFGVPSSFDAAGYNEGEDGNYVILKQARTRLGFGKARAASPELKSANGMIRAFIRDKNSISFTFKSHVPLKLEFWSDKACRISSKSAFRHERHGSVESFATEDRGEISGVLSCG